ncbi:MAG: Stp1/IreP family PP2C-type Ser/Thr phosphatase [Deltaproteobacteria bacterium]|nr:Stp1/IreP family PP2C-type Ser/Thr phosphatase [Deltaproteobacteria bacterium]
MGASSKDENLEEKLSSSRSDASDEAARTDASEPASKRPTADDEAGDDEAGDDESDDEAGDDEAGDDEADDGEADDDEADDGEADDGKADDGKADDGEADDGKADDGEADDGEADDGEADDGEADDGEADDGKAKKPVQLLVFGQTDVGQIREHNEDNFLLANLGKNQRGLEGSGTETWSVAESGLLLAVCDGMGGAAAGEVASQMATDIIFEHMSASAGHGERDGLAVDIVKALEQAGSKILAEATSNRACRGMGTTATVAALVDDHLLLGQVGDSRAYILRGGRLVQVTRDQSLVNQLIEAGQLTEEEAENFEHSNIILQALGTADSVQVDLTYVALRRGDVLMMCSDGLSGMLRDKELLELLSQVDEPAEACRALIEEANLAGGHDNISVILARFDGEGLPELDDAAVASLKYLKYPLASGGDGSSAEGGKGRGHDDSPSIEVHGEYEVEGDVDWDQMLTDKRMIPMQSSEAGMPTWAWALVIGAVILLYLLYRP